ncbi:MAG: M48 family metallopeptidase [Nocardioides sp.]
MTARQVGAALSALAAIALGLLLWWTVPWHPLTGLTPDPVPATSVFNSAEIARAEVFSATARRIGLSSYAVSLAVLCVLGFTGLGARLITRMHGPWLLRLACGAFLVLLGSRVVTLPWAVAAQRNRREFGLTSQPWPEFARDVGTEFAINVAVAVVVTVILVGSARRWARAWPAVAGSALMAFTMVASFGYPVVIEPLFNSFEPLPEGELRTAVFSLAEAEHVPLDDVLIADASQRTTSLNAYVSGFGATRRVVLYDTLVSGAPIDEVVSVVAHELAHARHDDVLVGSSLGALVVLLGVGLLGIVVTGQGSRSASMPPVGEPAVVPLLVALTAIAGLVAAPAQNAVSRRFETRADVEAVVATGDGSAAEKLQRTLALRSFADPTPPRLTQWWFGTHPTVLERISLARAVTTEQAHGSPRVDGYRSHWRVDRSGRVKRWPS